MIDSAFGPMRVFHLREFDFDGNVCNTGGATYVFVHLEGKGWIYSHAHCSNKDNFCRKIGRNIARGRMEAGHYKFWTRPHIPNFEEVERLYALESLKELVKGLPQFEVFEYA